MKANYLFALLCAAAIGFGSPVMARGHGGGGRGDGEERGDRGDRGERGDGGEDRREDRRQDRREDRREDRGEGRGDANFARNHPRRDEVNDRGQNQQGRIANGVRNGSLQPGETSHIEKQEAGIKHQEAQDVKQNGGYLTKGEQNQINHEQNQVSKEIYTDKHNEGGTSSTGGSQSTTGKGSFAQQHPRRAEVNAREENQQDRIANGVRNGSLQPGETSHIEKQEAGIKHQEAQDVKQNGGYLTKGEQNQINHEQNQVSKEIYTDKHNEGGTSSTGGSQSTTGKGSFAQQHPRRAEVNAREENQQDRIANGVGNGSLQPGETSHIEKQEAGIKHQEAQDVKQNGGYLTKGEQNQINHEQNQVSKEIYKDKHNEGTTPSNAGSSSGSSSSGSSGNSGQNSNRSGGADGSNPGGNGNANGTDNPNNSNN